MNLLFLIKDGKRGMIYIHFIVLKKTFKKKQENIDIGVFSCSFYEAITRQVGKPK